MRIFIMCDLEGTAGVVDFETQVYAGARYLEDVRRLATLELNALIDGCIEGGASDVVVVDGHGIGGLQYELLHRDARMLMGRPVRPPYGLDDSFDAQLLYGHHAMNNVAQAVLCHSWDSRRIDTCWLNDEPVGEIGVECAVGGYFGVPTVFVSGDLAGCDEARRYVPQIEAVVTKEGVSRTSALCLAAERSRQLHREAGQRAVQRASEVAPYVLQPPFEFRTRYYHDGDAARAAGSGAERVDQHTVAIRGNDLLEVITRR